MSARVAMISQSVLRECIGIYALIYYAQKTFFNVLHAVIIKRGRTKINKLWVWGKPSKETSCLY
jgi:hypothetical protein